MSLSFEREIERKTKLLHRLNVQAQYTHLNLKADKYAVHRHFESVINACVIRNMQQLKCNSLYTIYTYKCGQPEM